MKTLFSFVLIFLIFYSLLSYLFRPERLSLSLSNSSITKSRQLFVKNVVEKLKLMLSPLLKLSYSSSESFSLADEDSMLQLQKTLFDRETENGQELLQLLDTVGRFVDACLKSIYYADGKDFFPLLPYVRNEVFKLLSKFYLAILFSVLRCSHQQHRPN